MKKTMTSKKGAKEETEKNNKFDQARSKKSIELKKFFFHSFLPLRAPESPPKGWGAAEAGYAWPCVNPPQCLGHSLACFMLKMDLPLTSLCTSQVLIACEKRSKLTSELVSF